MHQCPKFECAQNKGPHETKPSNDPIHLMNTTPKGVFTIIRPFFPCSIHDVHMVSTNIGYVSFLKNTSQFQMSQRIRKKIWFFKVFFFLGECQVGYPKNNFSKIVFLNPILIDLRIVGYPQLVMTNNLYQKIQFSFLKLKNLH